MLSHISIYPLNPCHMLLDICIIPLASVQKYIRAMGKTKAKAQTIKDRRRSPGKHLDKNGSYQKLQQTAKALPLSV